MLLRLRQFLAAVLPITAILSLVCGPSPSAAYAQCRERLAKERKADRGSHHDQNGTRPAYPTAPSESAQDAPNPAESKKDGQGMVGAYVVPVTAKPADTEKVGGNLAVVGRAAFQIGPHGSPGLCQSILTELPFSLHYPVYHANAPPAM